MMTAETFAIGCQLGRKRNEAERLFEEAEAARAEAEALELEWLTKVADIAIGTVVLARDFRGEEIRGVVTGYDMWEGVEEGADGVERQARRCKYRVTKLTKRGGIDRHTSYRRSYWLTQLTIDVNQAWRAE